MDAANLQKATATTGEELRSRLAALMEASKNQNSAFNRFRRVSGSSTSAVSLPEFRVAVEALQLFATPTAVDDCFRMMVEGSSDQQITYGIFVKALFGDHGKETSLTTSDQVRAQRIKKANDRAAQLAAFASAQAAQEGGADGGILADPVFRFRERMLHRASTKSALLGEFNKLRVACHIGADVDGIPFENFTQLGLRSLGLELSAAQGAVLFKALDINKSGVVKFEDFCRLVFQSDNMVIDSHDHNKQRAADRAASLALRAAAVGRITSGKELLDAFRRKMEGKPNISLAFNKFRRLSGSADGTLTQQQFQTAMIKSGTNATQVCLLCFNSKPRTHEMGPARSPRWSRCAYSAIVWRISHEPIIPRRPRLTKCGACCKQVTLMDAWTFTGLRRVLLGITRPKRLCRLPRITDASKEFKEPRRSKNSKLLLPSTQLSQRLNTMTQSPTCATDCSASRTPPYSARITNFDLLHVARSQ